MCKVGLECQLYLQSVKIVSISRMLEDDRRLLDQRQGTYFLIAQQTTVSTRIFARFSSSSLWDRPNRYYTYSGLLERIQRPRAQWLVTEITWHQGLYKFYNLTQSKTMQDMADIPKSAQALLLPFHSRNHLFIFFFLLNTLFLVNFSSLTEIRRLSPRWLFKIYGWL